MLLYLGLLLPLQAALFWPLTVHDGAELEFRGVEDDVFHLLPLPSVSDVDAAVTRLDDGGVAVFAGLILEHEGGAPGGAVLAGGEVQRGAFATPFAWGAADVVIDDEVCAIGEGDGVGATVVVGQGAELDLPPGFAAVAAADFKDAVLA